MIPVLKRKVWDWILPEYFGYLVDWTMSTFHTCIIALLLTSKTKCCDQLKEDLLNYISSLECFLIFSCWRQENKHFVVDTLFLRKCKMTSPETETHCVGSYSSNDGSFKNPILVLNEIYYCSKPWNFGDTWQIGAIHIPFCSALFYYWNSLSFTFPTFLTCLISDLSSTFLQH